MNPIPNFPSPNSPPAPTLTSTMSMSVAQMSVESVQCMSMWSLNAMPTHLNLFGHNCTNLPPTHRKPHFAQNHKEREREKKKQQQHWCMMAMMEITEAYGVMADGNDNKMSPIPPLKRSRSQRRRRSSLNFASLEFPSLLSHVPPPPPPPPLPAARVCPFSLALSFNATLMCSYLFQISFYLT